MAFTSSQGFAFIELDSVELGRRILEHKQEVAALSLVCCWKFHLVAQKLQFRGEFPLNVRQSTPRFALSAVFHMPTSDAIALQQERWSQQRP